MNRQILSVLGASLLFAACTPAAPSGAPAPGQTAPQEARSENQVIRLGTSLLYPYLTPQANTVYNYNIWPMYDNLTQFGPKYSVTPSVAEKWELGADKLSWTFTIRKDMTFADGSPLTAEDAAFSLNLAMEKNWPIRAYFANVTAVKATNATTLVITTKVPDATVPNGGPFLMVLPKAYYEKVGDDGFRAKPMGSGPYELVKFVPEDSLHYKVRSTPHAFRKPANTELQFKYVPDPIQLMNGILTDQYDVLVGGSFSGDQIEQMKGRGMTMIARSGGSLQFMMPQGTYESKNTPLKDIRVRQAMNYAVNRQQIVTSMFKGQGMPSGQILVPDSPAWNDAIPAFPHDLNKAKQLLSEAGFANGFKVTMNWNPASVGQEVPLAVQADLKAVGIEMEIQQVEGATFSDLSAGRNNSVKGDLFVFGLAEANGMAQFSTLGCNKPVGSAPSANYYCVPEAEKLNAQVLEESDPAKRVALMQQMTKVIIDQVPALYIMVRQSTFISGPKMRGMEVEVVNHYNHDKVYRLQ